MSVTVPDSLAGEVLRALVRDLTTRVRATGAGLSPECQRLLFALDAADRRHTTGSTPGTPHAAPATLDWLTVAETAQRLECSTGYVRRLARHHRLTARRTTAGWLINPTSLTRYRTGPTP